MTTYEPGTVAVATVRGVEGVRVMRTTGIGGADDLWLTAQHLSGWRSHRGKDVTHVRPLAVLDLDLVTTPEENAGLPAGPEIVKCLRLASDAAGSWRGLVTRRIADQIEAQTKPPRIPEPGLWGVVEATVPDANGSRWAFVRDQDQQERAEWTCTNSGDHYDWPSLIDPTLIREGLS